MNKPELFDESHSATYCPEDNKLRLYIGRVPRDEYEALRAEGWTSTPKQDCDFVAHWTPSRRDTALSYAGTIDDEDTPPQERAADRAERFSGYQEKRLDEATGYADSYDNKPSAHGFQSESRANRAVARHDRIGDRAGDQWSKAEYWQRRTSGVIEHALYKSEPSVRMGRIKILEAEERKHLEHLESRRKKWRNWQKLAAMEDAGSQTKLVHHYVGGDGSNGHDYKHPRPETVTNEHIREHGSSLWTLMGMVEREYGTSDITGAEACALYFAGNREPHADDQDEWAVHYALRLSYERQMLEAQGGRAGALEIIPGGWLLVGRRGRPSEARQIHKVNKSPTSGRVVSVLVQDNQPSTHNHWGNPYPAGETHLLSHTVEIERAGPDCYRPPTEEELTEFNARIKAQKAKRKAAAPPPLALINPGDEDAERLQVIINERHAAEWIRRHGKPHASYGPKTAEVERITQAVYSANSGGSYSTAETRTLHANGEIADRESNMWSSAAEARAKARGPALCKIRIAGYDPIRVLIITDKPQKALPAATWEPVKPAIETAAQD